MVSKNNGYQDSEMVHRLDICPDAAAHLTGGSLCPGVPVRRSSGVACTLHSPGEQGTFTQHSGLCAPPLSWHLPSPFVFCWLIVNKYQMRSSSLPDSATEGTVVGTEYLLAPTGQRRGPRLATCLLRSWLLVLILQCLWRNTGPPRKCSFSYYT